jgi:hypothetical protein
MSPRKPPAAAHRPAHVFQLLVVLAGTDPLVWRRILVPETYSFWDLHVALQDAVGWKDCHLHEFIVVDAKALRGKRVGMPDDEFADQRPTLAGWKVPIARHLTLGSQPNHPQSTPSGARGDADMGRRQLRSHRV